MDFYNKFRAFLGLPTPQQPRIPSSEESRDTNLWKDYHKNDNENYPQTPSDHRHFNIFTDPLEMSRYFEQQMDEMLRSFGFGNFFKDFHVEHFGGNFGNQLEDDDDDDETSSGELRDRFLKPGYENDSTRKQSKEDGDMDGKVDIRDLGRIFGKESAVVPREKFQSFSKNIVTSTIMNPDGSMETRNTFKDSQGNEETRITHRKDDKEYTIIKRIDRDGRETITENFINLEKDQVDKYFPSRNNPDRPSIHSPNWGFFDRFF